MFGLFRSKKAKALDELEAQIGKCLHKQIREALENAGDNLAEVEKRANGGFAGAYLYSFAVESFSANGLSKQNLLKRSKNIFNGILPGSGPKLVQARLEQRMLAEEMDGELNDARADTMMYKSEFDMGIAVARVDAHKMIDGDSGEPSSLKEFLLKGMLDTL